MAGRGFPGRWSLLVALGGAIAALWVAVQRLPTSRAATTAPATSQSAEPATAPAVSGDVTKVRRGSLALSLDFDGVFEPVDPFEVRLKARRYQGDFVIKKVITAGAAVSKGDVLLSLGVDKIDTQIAAAENEAKIALVNQDKAEADVKLGQQGDALAMSAAKDEQSDAQTALRRWDDSDGPAFQLAGGMQAKEADFTLESQADELDQLKKMYKSEDLTNETADIVLKRAMRMVELYKILNKISHVASDRMTQFEATVQRQHLSNGADHQVQSVAQLEAEQTHDRAIRETSLVTAQAAVTEAQKKLAELKQDRDAMEIKSGVDGVVVYGSFSHKAWTEVEAKKLAVDEKVSADQVLMTVYSPKNLRLRADWPEAQIGLLVTGAKVKVSPVAMADLSYSGTCEPVSIFGTGKGESQVFDVVVDLPTVDEHLAPGFKANVNFDGGKIDDALLVPVSAVWRGKVWVRRPLIEGKAKEPGEDEMRSVVVGQSDGRVVQIKSGLEEGELVVTQAKKPGAS